MNREFSSYDRFMIEKTGLMGFKQEIEEMLSDPDMEVKQAAIKILKRL